jgi:dTDP-4-dehydrorhamnose reductase|tara:strand:+ start:1893 stop:2807 length:915 start_codon:yes stop_codon:yes gene_type:complete
MKKLLVTGASGLLGASIVYELNRYFEIYAVYNEHKIISRYAKYFKLDLTDKEMTEKVIETIKPDIIIHTAAMTNVDLCESKPELAKKANVEATGNIVDACKKFNIKLIHISTDYVFDGEKGDYTELDKQNPVDVYAQTKCDAENIVNTLDNTLIIRTSIYGWNLQKKQSFVEWVLSTLRDEKEVPAITDQKTSMIFVNDLAKIIKFMIHKNLKGIYNVASQSPLSKYKVALKTAAIFGLDQALIKPTTTEELMKKVVWKAERPKNTSLNISKIEKLVKMPSFDESLDHMKKLENSYKKQFVDYA